MDSDTTQTPEQNQAESSAVDSAGNGTRGRSKIGFPYMALKDAEQIATELQNHWGGSASPEQLAGSLGQKPSSGAFRMKVATARTFGVVNVARGNISLSPLGKRIIDPQVQGAARVEAFKTVPLFRALLNEYSGDLLPPDGGLETKIRDLGVSPKQTAKARQAFQRSADLAGFFRHGRNRLVEPPTNLEDSSVPKKQPEEGDRVNPLQAGSVPLPDLWLTLLNESDSWSAEKTKEFVEKARELLDVLKKT